VVIAAFMWASAAAKGLACSEDTSSVMVSGIVAPGKVWGPRGFGETPETDSRFTIFTLRLDEPRTSEQVLPRGGKQDREKVAIVQLWCDSSAFPGCELLLKKSVRHRIIVCGQAAREVAATSCVPVTISVRSIKLKH
jgi:hypothetical protein